MWSLRLGADFKCYSQVWRKTLVDLITNGITLTISYAMNSDSMLFCLPTDCDDRACMSKLPPVAFISHSNFTLVRLRPFFIFRYRLRYVSGICMCWNLLQHGDSLGLLLYLCIICQRCTLENVPEWLEHGRYVTHYKIFLPLAFQQ